MPFTSETSATEKDPEYRSETKKYQILLIQCLFCIQNDWLQSKQIEEDSFSYKSHESMDYLSILSISSSFLKHRVTKDVHTSIFTCAHYLLCGDPLTTILHGNNSDLTLICQMSQSP